MTTKNFNIVSTNLDTVSFSGLFTRGNLAKELSLSKHITPGPLPYQLHHQVRVPMDRPLNLLVTAIDDQFLFESIRGIHEGLTATH